MRQKTKKPKVRIGQYILKKSSTFRKVGRPFETAPYSVRFLFFYVSTYIYCDKLLTSEIFAASNRLKL